MSRREEYEAIEADCVERTKSAICDICHYPFVTKDEGTLEAICEACPAMASLDGTVKLIRAGREAIGGVNAALEIRELTGLHQKPRLNAPTRASE